VDIKTRAFEKIARQLKNLDCDYMIVPETGPCFKRGNFKYAKRVSRGLVVGYVDQFIEPLQPGMSTTIPAGEFPLELVGQTASYRSYALFGKGNFLTHKNAEKNIVEVLCMDRQTDDEPEEEEN